MAYLTELHEWHALEKHYQHLHKIHMRQLFAADAARTERFTVKTKLLSLDYSKNRITTDTIALLCQLAHACHLPTKINAMFQGDIVNITEQHPALHTALRDLNSPPIQVNGKNVIPLIKQTLTKMTTFVEQLHQGNLFLGQSQPQKITDVVNIGIGGSERGPMMAVAALKPYRQSTIHIHFIANIDGDQLAETLSHLNPATTIFLISSKSFTTTETLVNMASIKEWLGESRRQNQHLFAITANPTNAIAQGINQENIFEFWDWVGGRYSLWSATGLPIAIAIGMPHFKAMLDGALDMDQHFRQSPLSENLPVILGLLGIWYINFFEAHTHAILPYSHQLRYFPSYLKQLDMESNGKQVNAEGNHINYATGPIIWGEAGCNGQHAFHQWLFQAKHLAPADFILPLQNHSPYTQQQHLLAANCFSQAEALMRGQTAEEVALELRQQGQKETDIQRILPFKIIPGNQPSNMLLMEKLTPAALGSLIALYEHKIFVQSAIWNINPFDQFGVELGKKMSTALYQQLTLQNE